MKKIILLASLAITLFNANATHLRAGYISVEPVNCGSRLFKITITVFTDTESSVLFGGTQDVLDFGDGTKVLVPETPNSPVPGGGNIGVASRSFLHSFPGPGRYTISYIEPNRNAGVLNMSNSVNTTFYTETQIDIGILGCSTSPQILVPPIDVACVGNLFSYNPGAYDPDGDSLSYEFVIPFSNRNVPVTSYRVLNDPAFYPNFPNGNEAGDGSPTLSINSEGTVVWDAAILPPGIQTGEYSLAFAIKEWRKINGQWANFGFVRLDMQVIVERCNNNRPRIINLPQSYCVEAGTVINQQIAATDPDNNQIKIEAISQIFNSSSASLVPEQVFQASPAQVHINWNTTVDHIQKNPYQIVLKVTDNPSFGPKLSTYESFSLKVIGKAPTILPVVFNEANRSAQISWNTYPSPNATMQVWRRVGSTELSPEECQTGIPGTLGFELIGEVPPSSNPITQFNDTNDGLGLNVGAKYCYRLVAVFPYGAESYVSEEICIDPISITAPVINKVSITKTHVTAGEIQVGWTPPFNIDTEQFPEPYSYIVQRDNGTGFVNTSSKISEVSFTDINLNTTEKSYTYRILLFSNNSVNSVGTSAVASSIRLSLEPSFQKIDLTWQANVPWSNQLAEVSVHEIYRGINGESENSFTQLATVNVFDGSAYSDIASPDNVFTDEIYCYRVVVKGGYDNPALEQPLVNYSQVNCVKAIIVNADEIVIPEIHVYPNPTPQFLKLVSENLEATEVLLFDQQGRLILKQAAQNGETIIDLSELKNGLYICDIRKGPISLKRIRVIKN